MRAILLTAVGFTIATAMGNLPAEFGIGLVLAIVAGLVALMIKLVK